MGFDTKGFDNARFTPREGEVIVDGLKEFYDDDEKPVWKVRGLTGMEIGKTKIAVHKEKAYDALLTALKSDNVSDKVDAIKELLSMGNSRKQGDIAERLFQMVEGSVEPKCTLERAIKVCKVSAVDFYNITNKILELSGQGQEIVGKPKGCTQEPISETA